LIDATLGIRTFYELAFGLPLALFHGILPGKNQHSCRKDSLIGQREAVSCVQEDDSSPDANG
jgi:hypothetical protein